MKIPEPIRQVHKHLSGIDWDDEEFEAKKAYVAAIFSELTYLRIPEFEIEGTDKANLIPCANYQEMMSSREKIDFDEIMREMDLGKYFVVERRYAVVVGIVTPDVIFIAIRGTDYAYEKLNNLRVIRKYKYQNAKFHKGFFTEALGLTRPIESQLRRMLGSNNSDTPIYLTGHSLGGAIAAILNAVWSENSSFYSPLWRHFDQRKVNSCYAFGMPRYGNDRSISDYSNPYHIINNGDIVPTLPPRLMRYEDSACEYQLSDKNLQFLGQRPSGKFLERSKTLLTGKTKSSHAIETYRSRIGHVIGV